MKTAEQHSSVVFRAIKKKKTENLEFLPFQKNCAKKKVSMQLEEISESIEVSIGNFSCNLRADPLSLKELIEL